MVDFKYSNGKMSKFGAKLMINNHINIFLEQYINSKINFAVLLKGQWGCGKTHFIKSFMDKIDNKKIKFVYLSLYGVTNTSEIENKFLEEIHPLLNSKPAKLVGSILKGALKLGLKVDLDGDSVKDTVNIQTPNINILDYVNENYSDFILVFDDLERIDMSVEVLLGYINYFVEHQDTKVIILANEEQIVNNQNINKHTNYNSIKEKLIGKTFEVNHSIDNIYETFLTTISERPYELLLKNKATVISLYNTAGYNNLRHLKQSIWDFSRLTNIIDKKFLSHDDLMKDIIQIFFAFSIEVKSGNLDVKSISKLSSYILVATSEKEGDQSPKKLSILNFSNKYPFIKLSGLTLPDEKWQQLMDQGYIYPEELNNFLEMSKHFEFKNRAPWVKLWYWRELEDSEFKQVYSEVLKNLKKQKYTDPNIILHIFLILLSLSRKKIISTTIDDIESQFYSYIDKIIELQVLKKVEEKQLKLDKTYYAGLQFSSLDHKLHSDFLKHLKLICHTELIDRLSIKSNELIALLPEKVDKFIELLSSDNIDNPYRDTPFFININVGYFAKKLISIENHLFHTFEHKLVDRYVFPSICKKITSESIFWSDPALKKRTVG